MNLYSVHRGEWLGEIMATPLWSAWQTCYRGTALRISKRPDGRFGLFNNRREAGKREGYATEDEAEKDARRLQ